MRWVVQKFRRWLKWRRRRDLVAAFAALEAALEKHHDRYKLSFGLEYSNVVDWVADLTPRRNHPRARQYGEVWRGQGTTPTEAIHRALRAMADEIGS